MNKIQLPIYVFDAVLRHYERIVEESLSRADTTKLLEATRLAKQDLRKLRKIKEQQESKWKNLLLESTLGQTEE